MMHQNLRDSEVGLWIRSTIYGNQDPYEHDLGGKIWISKQVSFGGKGKPRIFVRDKLPGAA